MKHNALVIMWSGKEAPNYIIAKIAELLIANKVCIRKLLTIKSLNEDDITKAISMKTIDANPTDETTNAVQNAFEYIGTRFAVSLNNCTPAFAACIADAVAIAKTKSEMDYNLQEDELALMNAIRILQKADASSWKIGRVFKIGNAARDVICSLKID
jgi:hypothetical protein